MILKGYGSEHCWMIINFVGTAFAFFNLADDLGKGAGPVLVVALIKACGGARRYINFFVNNFNFFMETHVIRNEI
jgi:hypothetical protein